MIVVRDDGVYLHLPGGQEIWLPGIARVTASGGVVIRFPARDVTVVQPLDTGRHVDCSDFQHCLLAVVLAGIALADIQAISPAMATLVQTYMTNHSLTTGGVD